MVIKERRNTSISAVDSPSVQHQSMRKKYLWDGESLQKCLLLDGQVFPRKCSPNLVHQTKRRMARLEHERKRKRCPKKGRRRKKCGKEWECIFKLLFFSIIFLSFLFAFPSFPLSYPLLCCDVDHEREISD